MRAIIVVLALSACATAPTSADYNELVGCWAEREASRVETMSWSASGAGWAGEFTSFAPGDVAAARQSFTLAQEGDGWRLCETSVELAPCWQVAHESRGSLEGGRAFIDRFADRLRIGVIGGDGAERKIFEGEREACPA